MGSPPRMRGEHGGELGGLRHQRITPAYAGRTVGAMWTPHPDKGSPPRMRGELSGQSGGEAFNRITPAYAGRTDWRPWWQHPHSDHPRVCGENDSNVTAALVERGSPPRMRGERRPASRARSSPGITPAYAGRTDGHSSRARHEWDHPRVCGENDRGPLAGQRHGGSPPRMRGERCCYFLPTSTDRITPAYAGRTYG